MNKQPSYLYELLVQRSDIHNVNLRGVNFYNFSGHNTERFKCSFSYLAAAVHKEHIDLFRSSCSVNVLKSRIFNRVLALQISGAL